MGLQRQLQGAVDAGATALEAARPTDCQRCSYRPSCDSRGICTGAPPRPRLRLGHVLALCRVDDDAVARLDVLRDPQLEAGRRRRSAPRVVDGRDAEGHARGEVYEDGRPCVALHYEGDAVLEEVRAIAQKRDGDFDLLKGLFVHNRDVVTRYVEDLVLGGAGKCDALYKVL